MSIPASSEPELHIRSLIDAWTEALRAKDVTGRPGLCTPVVIITDGERTLP